MQKNKARKIIPGDPTRRGVTFLEGGMNFAVDFDTTKEVYLLLYKTGEKTPSEEILMGDWCRVGNVYAVFLPDFDYKKYQYNYRVEDEVRQDPCAVRILGKGEFGQLEEEEDPHKVRCGFFLEDFDWKDEVHPSHVYSDMILYKIHVRGYTKQRNSKVRHKGTFAGVTEKIPYFKELGINALELMPIYDFCEYILPENLPLKYACKMKEKVRTNFWGYASGNYYAPKPAYCASKDGIAEVQNMVKSLHEAGIECILEFFFPGECEELQVLNVLRYWYLEYHVDGFHLIGDGVPRRLIRQDPLLKKAKLMFLDIPDCPREDQCDLAHKHLAEYNEGFKQDMRRFLKSDEDSLENALMRMRRNPLSHGIINYIANQDGFTLADLVSYDGKHNEANGEDNRDGNSYNFSWNCGVEGPSRKLAVRKLRQKQMRNAFSFLMLSQGVPMIYGGDEFGNSQQGNNNAYCQDNEIGWVDWKAQTRNKDLFKFVKEMIAFRKEHRVFHQEQELRLMDYQSTGYPDLSYHSSRAWYAEYDNISRYVGLMYCCDFKKGEPLGDGSFFYVAYNFHWEAHDFALPNLPDKLNWHRIMDTAREGEDSLFSQQPELLKNQKSVEVAPRSIEIFMGLREKK